MNDNQPVYTVTELMKRWKMSRKTILDAIHQNKLGAFKLGERAYRVPLAEVLRYEAVKAA